MLETIRLYARVRRAARRELEDELARVNEIARRAVILNTFSPGGNPSIDAERELKRWRSVNQRATLKQAQPAGWTHVSSFTQPRLWDWGTR
jgi:hypothetical protein